MKLYGRIRSVYDARYLLLNLVVLLAYYLVIEKLLAIQQFGIAFSAAPAYLVIALAVTSSVLMTIAVYTILESRRARGLGAEEAVGSCATALVGGVLSGCGCQGAIAYSALAIVLGGGEAYAMNTILTEHIALILAALTIFNIAFIVYSLGRLPGGRAK